MSPVKDLELVLASKFSGIAWKSDENEIYAAIARECMRQMRWIAARAADYQSAKHYGDVDAMSGKLSLAPEGWEAPEDWFPLP